MNIKIEAVIQEGKINTVLESSIDHKRDALNAVDIILSFESFALNVGTLDDSDHMHLIINGTELPYRQISTIAELGEFLWNNPLDESKVNKVADVIIQNDELLDAHTAIVTMVQALEFYKDGSIHYVNESAHCTLAQDDAGCLAADAHALGLEALADIEEYIDISAGVVAHG